MVRIGRKIEGIAVLARAETREDDGATKEIVAAT
jgi:hypothetical protein